METLRSSGRYPGLARFLVGRVFYEPSDEGLEQKIAERLGRPAFNLAEREHRLHLLLPLGLLTSIDGDALAMYCAALSVGRSCSAVSARPLFQE